jgi:hypothetical protein
MMIMSGKPSVPAAPNKVKIKAMVLSIKQDSQFSDKWHLGIEILDSESIAGPNFARKGEKTMAFAFDSTPGFSSREVSPGSTISAEAEYVGDATHGAFRLDLVKKMA